MTSHSSPLEKLVSELSAQRLRARVSSRKFQSRMISSRNPRLGNSWRAVLPLEIRLSKSLSRTLPSQRPRLAISILSVSPLRVALSKFSARKAAPPDMPSRKFSSRGHTLTSPTHEILLSENLLSTLNAEFLVRRPIHSGFSPLGRLSKSSRISPTRSSTSQLYPPTVSPL
jgi:hypothetical protein